MRNNQVLIPHDVVSRMVDGASAIKAWREHVGLTQATLADRMGITQPAYAQLENSSRPRKATRQNVAKALGVQLEQLSV